MKSFDMFTRNLGDKTINIEKAALAALSFDIELARSAFGEQLSAVCDRSIIIFEHSEAEYASRNGRNLMFILEFDVWVGIRQRSRKRCE